MKRALAATTVACLALAAPAYAAHVIGRGHASGDYAIATASGSVTNPGTIKVTVTAKPNQKVDVNWTMVCSEPGGGVGSKDGAFKARTPFTRSLKKPASRVTDCTVSALGSLSKGGKITVKLTG
jgi:hypothetical protein